MGTPGWQSHPLKPSLVTLCLPPALLGQAIAKFSVSLSPHPMISIPWNPFICSLAVCLLHSNATLPGRGWSFVLCCVLSACPEKAHDRRVLRVDRHSCLWENSCFPWSPQGRGSGGSGPTFALGASMLHATERGTNSWDAVGWAGHLGMCPVILAGPWAEQGPCSLALPWSLSSRGWSPPPPPLGLSTPGDGYAGSRLRVRAPASTPEPLLLSVRWALPPPLCHL